MVTLTISSINFVLFGLSCFMGGVLASFSPCVYPIIPIVISYIGTNARDWKESLYYATAFAFGLSIVYILLGIFAGTAGIFMGKWAGSPLLQLFMGFICFISAFHYWGLLKIPGISMSTGVISKKLTFWGAILLGCGSAIMASSCSAPIILVLLSYIASNKIGPWLGAFFLFVFAVGMGLVYIGISFFVGLLKTLPKAKNVAVFYNILPWILFILGVYFVFRAGRLW